MTHYSSLCMTHTPTVSCSSRCLSNERHDQFFQERWSPLPKLFVPCLGFDWQGWSYLFANFCPSSNTILERVSIECLLVSLQMHSYIVHIHSLYRNTMHSTYLIINPVDVNYVFHITANYLSPCYMLRRSKFQSWDLVGPNRWISQGAQA